MIQCPIRPRASSARTSRSWSRLEGLVDLAAEKARITKELAKTDKEIAFVKKKLDNEKFIARAPAEVVEKERAQPGR